MFEEVRKRVEAILKEDASGHGSDHVQRVYRLAMKFAQQENAKREIVGLAALLHDVDDYKLVGQENALRLANATQIMRATGVDKETELTVLEIIGTMGYSKVLKGVRPRGLEGKIVSDADMCDAIGATGIVRAMVYAVSPKGSGIIFDEKQFPNVHITQEEYNAQGTTHATETAINHFFEKLLKLPGLMMTDSGRKESVKRQKIMVAFLRHFFEEENVPEWNRFLEAFLSANGN